MGLACDCSIYVDFTTSNDYESSVKPDPQQTIVLLHRDFSPIALSLCLCPSVITDCLNVSAYICVRVVIRHVYE